MAIPSAPCGLGSDQCCTSLSDIASHLLSETFDALTECHISDCGEQVLAYVTMGLGDDGVSDSLTVSVGSVNPSAGTRPGLPGLYRAAFDVRLQESGWPTAYVDGDVVVLPDPVLQASASAYMLSRGEALHRRLAALAANRGLVPAGVRCSNGSVGALTTIRPQGGVVGWTCQVVVDLPWF